MKPRRAIWSAVFVALLGVSTWLNLAGDAQPLPAPAAAPVVYPRDVKPKPAPPPPARTNRRAPELVVAVEPPPPRPSLDALQRAVAVPGSGAVVFEVNAIRHSELALRILECHQASLGTRLSQVREETGLDLLEDIDRVAITDDVLAVGGFFDDLKDEELSGSPSPYGDGAFIYEGASDDHEVFARVGSDLMLIGSDRQKIEAAIDRVEGRSPAGTTFDQELAGGELYGQLDGAALTTLLADTPFAGLENIVQQAHVRALIDEHAALSFDFDVGEGQRDDVTAALRGALSALRMRAAQTSPTARELLKNARVGDDPEGPVGFDIAVPGEVLLQALGCAPDGTPLVRPEAELSETQTSSAP